MEKQQIMILFITSMITSAAGGILLFVTDFGGYWWYEWMGPTTWVYVCFTCNVIVGIVIFLAASMLLFCTFVSLSVILEQQGTKLSELEQEKLINMGIIFCYIVGTLSIIGAIAIGITGATIEAESSGFWLDAGFYGGIIGSALTALNLKYYQFKLEKEG